MPNRPIAMPRLVPAACNDATQLSAADLAPYAAFEIVRRPSFIGLRVGQ